MTRRRVFAVAVSAALMLMAGAPALADSPGLTVRFNFVAAGRLLSAGSYSVSTAPDGKVVLTPAKGGPAVEVAPLKTLKRGSIKSAELVFEQTGSMWYLTEVWLPDTGGYQIYRVDSSQDRKTVKEPTAK